MKLTVFKVYCFAALVVLTGLTILYMLAEQVNIEGFMYKALGILVPLAIFVGGMHLIMSVNKQKYIPEFIGLNLVGHLGIMAVAFIARGKDISLELASLILSGYFASTFFLLTGTMVALILGMIFYLYILRVSMYLEYKHPFTMAFFAVGYYVLFCALVAGGLFSVLVALL